MADCTTYGFSGAHVPLSSLLNNTTAIATNEASPVLPALLSGYTQAQNVITINVWEVESDGTQKVVATISGTSRANNNGITPTSLAQFSVKVNATYYATVTTASPPGQAAAQDPRVLVAYSTLSYGTTTYAGAYTLCIEDTPSGGDCDFNDCVASISWTLFAG